MRIPLLISPFRTPVLAISIALLVLLFARDARAEAASDAGEKGVPATKRAPFYRLDADIPGECERLSRFSYPSADQPTAAEAQDLRGCEAYQYYYGIGRRKNYVKARQCAFSQPVPESGFSGELILMMLYANGQGVSRNLELAKKAACNSGLAGDDLKESIDALRTMAQPTKLAVQTFNFCDLVGTERSTDLCTWVKAQVDIQKYEPELATRRRTWTRLQQTAFDDVQKKWKIYIDLHADIEERRVGSDAALHRRAVLTIGKAEFLGSLLAFETGTTPGYDEESYKEIDSSLNEMWRANVLPDLLSGKPEAQRIRRAQRAWLAYMESWVKFAAYRYGGVSPNVWRAYFTTGRMYDLHWICTQ